MVSPIFLREPGWTAESLRGAAFWKCVRKCVCRGLRHVGPEERMEPAGTQSETCQSLLKFGRIACGSWSGFDPPQQPSKSFRRGGGSDPFRGGVRPARRGQTARSGANAPRLDDRIEPRAARPRYRGRVGKHLDLTAEGQPREWHGRTFPAELRRDDPLPPSRWKCPPPFREKLPLPGKFPHPVEQLGIDPDLVVGLREIESEKRGVARTLDSPHDDGDAAGGRFKRRQSKAFLNRRADHRLGGAHRIGRWRTRFVGGGPGGGAKADGPSMRRGCRGEGAEIFRLIGRRWTAGDEQLRRRSQPPHQQDGLSDVFPAEDAARHQPDRPSISRHSARSFFGPCPRGRGDRVRYPNAVTSQFSGEVPVDRPIEHNVADTRCERKVDAGGGADGLDSGRAQFGPSIEALIEPEIVMMEQDGNAPRAGLTREFRREPRVASKREVVRPDNRAFRPVGCLLSIHRNRGQQVPHRTRDIRASRRCIQALRCSRALRARNCS